MKNAAMMLICLFAAMPLWGQRNPDPKEVAGNMRTALSKGDAVEFTFSFFAESQNGDVIGEEEGTFLAQGDSFKMETGTIEVFCDGSVKWLYDKINAEIAIFPHDPATIEIAEAPFAVLGRIDPDRFSFLQGVESFEYNGTDLLRIRIMPKEKNVSYTQVDISVNPLTWYPVLLEYTSVGGDRYLLDISGVRMTEEKEKSFFIPSQDLLDDPDVYVTDMR